MKKNSSTILAAVSCLLVIICLFQISNLNRRINTLENNLSSQVSQVRNEVNGISYNISTSLEEQASLLSDCSWEYGEADYDARTVELLCSVSPKEFASDTQAVIVVGDTEYPMTLSGSAFTATFDIPLFGETHAMRVLFREGGNTRTQLLDWYLSPRYDYLLTRKEQNFLTLPKPRKLLIFQWFAGFFFALDIALFCPLLPRFLVQVLHQCSTFCGAAIQADSCYAFGATFCDPLFIWQLSQEQPP